MLSTCAYSQYIECTLLLQVSAQTVNRIPKMGLSNTSQKITDIAINLSTFVIGECYKAVMSKGNFANLFFIPIPIFVEGWKLSTNQSSYVSAQNWIRMISNHLETQNMFAEVVDIELYSSKFVTKQFNT